MLSHRNLSLAVCTPPPSAGAVAVLLFLAFLSFSVPAHSQVSDGALAEELFRQGRALMGEKRFGEACPKLAESQRLDPSTGTLLNLAVCHEKQGKLATAWNEFNEARLAAQRDGRADRVAYAEERIAAIEPNLSRLTVLLPEEHDAKGLKVELDGTAVGRPALGVALPIDPGTHAVVVTAPGKEPWRTNVEIPEGAGNKSLTIPVLLDAPEEPPPAPTRLQMADAPSSESDGATQRYLAYGLGGLGVVGLGLGTFWGLEAKSRFDQSNERGCEGNECSREGADLRNSARDSGTLSTVAFAAGAAALGAGVVLYLTSPSPSPAQVGWRARIRSTSAGTAAEVVASW